MGNWRDNPHYQRMSDISRQSGLEMGPEDIRQFKEYRIPMECGNCHEQAGYFKPTVGRHVCSSCGAVHVGGEKWSVPRRK